jgi:hypothetical protein
LQSGHGEACYSFYSGADYVGLDFEVADETHA